MQLDFDSETLVPIRLTGMKRRALRSDNPYFEKQEAARVKRRRLELQRGYSTYPRVGYSSVPRARGASVTGEMKYFDTERATTAIAAVTTTWVAGTQCPPTTPAALNLCSPTVGAAINQRIGREIKVIKIKIKGRLIVPTQAAVSAADNGCLIRWLLVQDTQTNAAAMTGAQLLTDQVAADTTINAFQNLNNFGRFKVLKEKYFYFENPNQTGDPTAGDVVQGGFKRAFKCNYNFKHPVSVRFNATNGGTVADIVDNSFHVICGTDSNALVPEMAYVCRVGFKE